MSSHRRAVQDILWAIALFGLVAAAFRLWFGLGATTNLSDAFPWGLWKILNMVGGVALSTSGFTVGFLVYVLRLKRFEQFMKPAILIAFLGYGCSCTALLMDIGLPHRFWHPIVMWNINSFLFEVFWCVMLYFTVTAIELAPLIFERLRAEKISHALHRVAFVVVVIGISLSSLHHSSLGSLFLVTPQRLHPLWYTSWLPLLFIVSAIGAGLMVVVLAKMLWAKWYDPESVYGPETASPTLLIRITDGKRSAVFNRGPEGPDMPAVRSLSTIAASILGLFLILKIVDLLLHGGWSSLIAGTWESWLCVVELLFLAVLPILLVVLPWSRRSTAGIAVAAVSAATGLALNRLDVGIFGYFHDAGGIYFPSLAEWSLGFGVIAAAGLVFLFVAENLPIFGPRPGAYAGRTNILGTSFGTLRQLWQTALTNTLHRVSLIGVFAVPIAFVLMYPLYHNSQRLVSDVRPALGVNAERTVLRIDGNNSGVFTLFDHADHQRRLGDSTSCGRCHHVSIPGDRSTPCSRCHRSMNDSTQIFDHVQHLTQVAESKHLTGLHPTNFSCRECHQSDNPKTADGVKDCLECHNEDMFPAELDSEKLLVETAGPFRQVMHQTCIECHRKEAANVHKPHLSDCQTCHESLRPRPTPASMTAGLEIENVPPLP